MAASTCANSTPVYRGVLQEVGVRQIYRTPILCDNDSTRKAQKGLESLKRALYMARRINSLTEAYAAEELILLAVGGTANPSNGNTKPITNDEFTKMRDILCNARHAAKIAA